MQLVVVSAVSSAVSTVITMSTILLTVLFVVSFMVSYTSFSFVLFRPRIPRIHTALSFRLPLDN